ncbi:hypothetical protein Adt_10978 [Abeliophyllum distichum]|uniref:Uncharacterized protein n=1 Tax=Abeliophyllum distichum TaxID=126358 RepID=A0ABD1ULJ8_9LAMI
MTLSPATVAWRFHWQKGAAMMLSPARVCSCKWAELGEGRVCAKGGVAQSQRSVQREPGFREGNQQPAKGGQISRREPAVGDQISLATKFLGVLGQISRTDLGVMRGGCPN